MLYNELSVPGELGAFVQSIWHLSANAHPGDVITNNALPDGCVEVIHRIAGQSEWCGEQPSMFVAGICSEAAQLKFSGDAEFIGVRLWPWAFNRLSDIPAPQFLGRWIGLDPASLTAQLVADPDHVVDAALSLFESILADRIGQNVPLSISTAELAEASGCNHRAIQRWFQREIGLPPRRYFKLLRFQHAIQSSDRQMENLAQKAAASGYSDQSHMARNFKEYSGATASQIRSDAEGPFLKNTR